MCGGGGIVRSFELKPILPLLLFAAAAYFVINLLPMPFGPRANAFDSAEASIAKLMGAALLGGLTWCFVRRNSASRRALGLRITIKNARSAWAYMCVGAGLVAAMLLLLRCVQPFRIEAGEALGTGFTFSLITFLFGAMIEELAFRGYPFLRLRRAFGTVPAIAIISLAFGLFHFPGMQGVALLKMVATTGICSVLFCLAFLRSRTLWAAVALHAGMNITLHAILGAGAGDADRTSSPFRLVFDAPAPSWDPAFWSLMLVGTVAAVTLAVIPRRASNG